MSGIVEVLALEQLERDIFRGAVHPSVLERTFGGQVAGQALVSAVRTAPSQFRVHSLHGYFLRPGRPTQPTVYLVDRRREGRSFCTRRVTGIQDGEAIFTMSASFQIDDAGIAHQDAMPPVPSPDELVPELGRVGVLPPRPDQWTDWEVRAVPPEQTAQMPGLAARRQVWLRYREPLPPDPIVHVCALAYMSDITLIGTARIPHDGVHTQTASLDHAMWFLRPFRADDWLLYDQTSPSAGAGRALAQGRIFDRGGAMVAAVVQEGLMRLDRDRPGIGAPSAGHDEEGRQA